MDKLARWVGDNPRRRLEDELMDRINRHRRIRSEFRPMVQGVMRLEKEFGAEKQFHWLRAALSSKKERLETEWVHWDPLNSYAALFEEYINPTGTGLWHEFRMADREREVMVFPDGTGWRPRPVLTVMAVHSHWVNMRSERHYHTLAEAIAIVNRQLDVYGKHLLIVRIVTLEDTTYGAADAHSIGWLPALVERVRAQRSLLDIISWDRSLTPVPESSFDRDAPHSTFHVADPALVPSPHWRLDRCQ